MKCKNCEEILIAKAKYCLKCGQKANTHRLTLRHFIEHDVIHGVFHLDKGLPRTIKDILIRPGKVALDYIHGRRKKYYNFFYLLLLIIGFYFFLKSVCTAYDFEADMAEGMKITDEGTKLSHRFAMFLRDYKKVIIFSFIPFLTLSAAVVFRRLKLTLVELAIPSAIAVIGCSIFNILILIMDQFTVTNSFLSVVEDFIYGICLVSLLIFPLYTFATFIKGHYSRFGKIWRLMAFYIIFVSFIVFGFLIVAFVMSGKANASLNIS